jgi:hypothetical protein
MTVTRPRAERGAFPPGTEHYGRSLLGAPLIWFPALAADRESGLILAERTATKTPRSLPFPAHCVRLTLPCVAIMWCCRKP